MRGGRSDRDSFSDPQGKISTSTGKGGGKKEERSILGKAAKTSFSF